MNFLHTFTPEAVLISFGSINIYWYGLFIVSGILAAIIVILKLADYYRADKQAIIDIVFYVIIFGIIGARLYHVLLQFDYYSEYPAEIFRIWGGGLAIHGGILAGLLSAWLIIRKRKLNFWLTASLFVTGLSLAQAIGRWGNYFNMELYGRPTDLPWGIPIPPDKRSVEFFNANFFQPVFLYESLGLLVIFLVLILLHRRVIKQGKFKELNYKVIAGVYFIGYSCLRFFMEFIRIDATPEFLGLRWPQIVSLLLVFGFGFWLFHARKREQLEKK